MLVTPIHCNFGVSDNQNTQCWCTPHKFECYQSWNEEFIHFTFQERLLKSQKYSSDFMFPHMVHVQEWKKTRQDSLKIASYLEHTKNLGYNLKAVYMPDRVNEGKVFTHGLLGHKAGLRT